MKIRISLFSFFVLLIFSCGKDKRDLLFEMSLNPLEFTVLAGSNTIDTYYILFKDVSTHFEDEARAYGIDTTFVGAVLPGKAFIRSVFGEEYGSLFREIAVHICPKGDTDFKCGYEAFYWEFPSYNLGSDFDLVPNEPDLKALLMQERVNVQLWFRLAETPTESISSRLDLNFNVLKK